MVMMLTLFQFGPYGSCLKGSILDQQKVAILQGNFQKVSQYFHNFFFKPFMRSVCNTV